MPLIPLRPLLETVDKYHFAQGAFNVNAVAQAKAAIEVHAMRLAQRTLPPSLPETGFFSE